MEGLEMVCHIPKQADCHVLFIFGFPFEVQRIDNMKKTLLGFDFKE
jgi:hypothetical protein